MDSIETFIHNHSVEKTANTNFRDGFPIHVKVIKDTKPMSETEYELIFQMIKGNQSIPPFLRSADPHDNVASNPPESKLLNHTQPNDTKTDMIDKKAVASTSLTSGFPKNHKKKTSESVFTRKKYRSKVVSKQTKRQNK